MSGFKIAISGVGGGVGQSVIKSLQNTGYDLVGLDGEVLGTGLYAVPTSYVIPYAKSPAFIPALLEICKKEKVSLLFPGLDAELKPLSLNRDAFKAIGTTVVVSDPGVIDISDDKMLTYSSLTPAGIRVPFTGELAGLQKQLEFPVIIKQKVGGARSKNVFVIKNETEYKKTLLDIGNRQEDFIIQEYIEGDEYTCGSVNLGGQCKGVIVMKRTLRDGDTHKCFSLRDPLIEDTVKKIMNTIKPFGGCNVQLRMKDGIPYVFEINARCSGTTASRTLCGFNEPKMIADYLLKGIEPTYDIKELSILRYLKELVVDNDSVSAMGKDRTLHANHPGSL
ncbi:MAG: ATP-grasp domain-containing protein [Chitinophagaceae bacterium]